jgi:4a-hydroxytetrahydrobiopterin dehydratase
LEKKAFTWARNAVQGSCNGDTNRPGSETELNSMSDILDDNEIQSRLKKIPEWELTDGRIERMFEFDEFSEAIDFVNAVAEIAEDAGHHPDIDIRYNKVLLSLVTHSKNGLTENDFLVAEKLDTLED